MRALQTGGLLQRHLQDEYEQDLPSVSKDGCGRVCGQQRQWAEPTGGGPSPTDPLRSGVEPEVCSGCSCRYLQRLQLLHLAGSLISLQPVNLVFKGAAAPTHPPSCEGCPAIYKEPLNVLLPPGKNRKRRRKKIFQLPYRCFSLVTVCVCGCVCMCTCAPL